MKLAMIVIPFLIDKQNKYDNDVWQHAVETIKILKRELKSTHIVHFQPIVLFEKVTENINEIYIVAHGNSTGMGNDDEKLVNAHDVAQFINSWLQNNPLIDKIDLFSCESSKYMLDSGLGFNKMQGKSHFIWN